MRRQHGFSLVELLAALLILTFVILTTLAIFFDRRNRLQQANETVLAYQALSNEAEIWRRIDFTHVGDDPSFQSPVLPLAALAPYTTAVAVDRPNAYTKLVTLTIRWHNGDRTARLILVRTDTGGSNLW